MQKHLLKFTLGAMKGDSIETVILAHGSINPWWVMVPIGRFLKRCGFRIIYWDYPSRTKFVQEYAADLYAFIGGLSVNGPLHFVGFSLGSIIMRYTLSHYLVGHAGRFVMIGPPNQGCEKAERFDRYPLIRWVQGMRAIRQLFASDQAVHEECGIPPVEFGIIAGGTGNTNGFDSGLGQDNDGVVAVESTRLEGERDFVLLPHRHMGLVFSSESGRQTAHFLKQGSFEHA